MGRYAALLENQDHNDLIIPLPLMVLQEAGDVPEEETSRNNILVQEYRKHPHPGQCKHPHTYPYCTPGDRITIEHGVSFNRTLGLGADNNKEGYRTPPFGRSVGQECAQGRCLQRDL